MTRRSSSSRYDDLRGKKKRKKEKQEKKCYSKEREGEMKIDRAQLRPKRKSYSPII